MKEGARARRAGQLGDELFLLLDGVLSVEVDGEPLAELGPGAILGERAVLEEGRRTSTLRALTRGAAVARRRRLDQLELSERHRRAESQRWGTSRE